jgi:hypothetical protein
MKIVNALVGAAALAAVWAGPAAAGYVRLGSVDVGYRADMDTAYSEFGGRLESLRLVASRSDIYCRAVVVQYANGERQNVFSGRLDERRPVEVDLRGRARKVDSVRFACRSDEFRGGRIYVEGEVGNYRNEWRNDRNWDRRWAALFGGLFGGRDDMRGPDDRRDMNDRRDWNDRRDGNDRRDWNDTDRRGPDDRRDWNGGRGSDRGWDLLGRQVFQGGNDRTTAPLGGWSGRHISQLAVRPFESDVRCNRIIVNFDGGRSATLDKDRVLRRGEMNVYDVPGYAQNIATIYLRCHAIGNGRVNVDVFARR